MCPATGCFICKYSENQWYNKEISLLFIVFQDTFYLRFQTHRLCWTMVPHTLMFMIKYLSIQVVWNTRYVDSGCSEYIVWNTLFPFCLGKRCSLITLSLNDEHRVTHTNYPRHLGNKHIEHYIIRCRKTQISWFDSNTILGLCHLITLLLNNRGYTITLNHSHW